MAAAGFLCHYLSGPLPYNRLKNVLSVSLNKTFPSFLFRMATGNSTALDICIVDVANEKQCIHFKSYKQ